MYLDAAGLLPGIDPLGHLPLDYEPDVDIFAGGGGASTGFEEAFGKSPDLAINHDPEALTMHRANHPQTIHICQNVINVTPIHATGGRLLRALWASPDCTHFSRAKGGKPRNQFIRDLAWTVVRWAEQTRPKLIGVENVKEFLTWGPLDAEGNPIKARSGETFRAWVRALRGLGYKVSWRELRACDYGAPTTRARLLVVARLDGERILWPQPSHGPETSRPWRTAAECIDWNDPAPSIFARKKPLVVNTQRRIAEGVRRYVLEAQKPFLVTYYGAKYPGEFRGMGVDEPLRAQTTENRFALVNPSLIAIDHKGSTGCFRASCREAGIPLNAITTENRHALIMSSLAVAPSFIKYYSNGGQHSGMDEPLHTLTTNDRMGLQSTVVSEHSTGRYEQVREFLRTWGVIGPDDEAEIMIDGVRLLIVDIGLRMLRPRELFRATGFSDLYKIDPIHNGKPLTISSQVKKCGNAVPPALVSAVLGANRRALDWERDVRSTKLPLMSFSKLRKEVSYVVQAV